MTPLLYRILRKPAEALVRLFFRRLEVRGADRVPLRGPLLIAANHPNMLLDPLLLGTTQPRSISFLAKATLFRSRLLGSFLSACGVLPVYRRKDSPGETAKNELTFDACYRHLEKGGAIGIFPEGVSHERQAVLPLKTGCARIALEAEAQNGFRLGVRIAPVGLYFTARHVFRGDALVAYGEPVDPADVFDLYRREPQEAVRVLTAALEANLQSLTVHVPRSEDEAVVESVRRIIALPENLSERVEIDRTVVDAMDYVRKLDPTHYARLRRDVLRFGRLLRALDFEPEQLDRRYQWGQVFRYLAPRLGLAVLGLPVFLFGAVNNLLPYKVPAWISRLFTRDKVEMATVKLVSGMVSFPLFYALQTALVAQRFGALAGIFYLLALPLTGLAALGYLEALSGFGDELRVFGMHVLRRDWLTRLRRDGERIRKELEAGWEAYRRGEPGDGPSAVGPTRSEGG